MPTVLTEQDPAYHRAQARLGAALHIDALTLVRTLHLLTLCRLAVRLAHRRCPPPLPAGPGGAPRTYSKDSLLLLALLRTLWRLSFQDMHDWLGAWPALASGLWLAAEARWPATHSQSLPTGQAAGSPLPEALFVLSVLSAIRRRLIGARNLIIDSAPILAWRHTDPDAAVGHAPAQHPRPLLRGYRVHTLLCRGSGLPIFYLLSRANIHDAPFARPRHGMGRAPLRHTSAHHPPGRRLLGPPSHRLHPCHPARGRGHSPSTPSVRRTAPAYHPPGPKRNSAIARQVALLLYRFHHRWSRCSSLLAVLS